MTNAKHVACDMSTICCDYEEQYALWRHKLMIAAIDACRRYHRKHDGLLGRNYVRNVESVMTRIADDWPSDAAAWYLDRGTVRPSWIDRKSGRNLIQEDIDWWLTD